MFCAENQGSPGAHGVKPAGLPGAWSGYGIATRKWNRSNSGGNHSFYKLCFFFKLLGEPGPAAMVRPNRLGTRLPTGFQSMAAEFGRLHELPHVGWENGAVTGGRRNREGAGASWSPLRVAHPPLTVRSRRSGEGVSGESRENPCEGQVRRGARLQPIAEPGALRCARSHRTIPASFPSCCSRGSYRPAPPVGGPAGSAGRAGRDAGR